jgi:hypothetical protein
LFTSQLWTQYFPDVPTTQLDWLYQFDEPTLRKALEITSAKDRNGRFKERTSDDLGKYCFAVAKRLSTKVLPVSVSMVFADYLITPADSQRFLGLLAPCGECLIFTSGKGVYGRFKIDGRAIGAHVFAFFNSNFGRLPEQAEPKSLDVAHSCNQPRCCRPAHLSLTTRKVNLWQRDVLAYHPITEKLPVF